MMPLSKSTGDKMALPNCSKCGVLKEGSYRAESWCGKCIGARRKELRAERRTAKGLPEYGSGRDPKCKICRADKEAKYMDGSYCGKCKLTKLKDAYARKRTESGMKARRIGRNPTCNCGKLKEVQTESECRSCTNERKRRLRLKNKQDPEWVKLETERNISRYRDNLDQQIKRLCRDETRRALRKGYLKYEPCEVCGLEDAQAHHDDYTKPLNIRWLCSWHHAEHHKNEKK